MFVITLGDVVGLAAMALALLVLAVMGIAKWVRGREQRRADREELKRHAGH